MLDLIHNIKTTNLSLQFAFLSHAFVEIVRRFYLRPLCFGSSLVKIAALNYWESNGRHEVRRVEIADSLFEGEIDKEMIEDLIAAACNDASRRVEEESKAVMSKVTAGIPLPPGMKLPF